METRSIQDSASLEKLLSTKQFYQMKKKSRVPLELSLRSATQMLTILMPMDGLLFTMLQASEITIQQLYLLRMGLK